MQSVLIPSFSFLNLCMERHGIYNRVIVYANIAWPCKDLDD